MNNLLTQSGDNIVTENGNNIVVFKNIQINVGTTGSIIVTGQYFDSYRSILYTPTGFIRSSGAATASFKRVLTYEPDGSIMQLDGESVATLKYLLEYYESDGYIVEINGESQFSRSFFHESDGFVVVIKENLEAFSIYNSINQKTYYLHPNGVWYEYPPVLPQISVVYYYLNISDCKISYAGEADKKYLIKSSFSLNLSLSNILEARLIRVYSPTGGIVSAGSPRIRQIIKHNSDGSEIVSAGDGISKITIPLRSSFTITLSNILYAKSTRISSPTGGIVSAGSPRIRQIIKHNSDGSEIVSGGDSISKSIITLRSRFTITLSNTLYAKSTRISRPTGGIVSAGSPRIRQIIKHNSDGLEIVSGGGGGVVKYLIKPRSRFTITLSNTLYAKSTRISSPTGGIVSAGSPRIRQIIKHNSDGSEIVSGGDSISKSIITLRSRFTITLSNILYAKATRGYLSNGSISINPAAKSIKNIGNVYAFVLPLSLLGSSDSRPVYKFSSLIQSSQFSLSNDLNFKAIFLYNPPRSPILSNSAFNYRNTIGERFTFNVTGSNTGQDIWGTDFYTVDSNLQLISVHAGLLSPGQNGNIVVQITDGQNLYPGSEINGIISKTWRSNTYSRSLRVFPVPFSITGTGFRSYIYSSLSGIIEISGNAEFANSQISTIKLSLDGLSEQFVRYNYSSDLSLLVTGLFFGGSLSFQGSGSADISGSSKCIIIRKYSTSGANILLFSSLQDFTVNKLEYIPPPVYLDLVSDEDQYQPEVLFNFELNSTWLIGGNGKPDFSKNFDSKWYVKSDQYYWYRVLFCGSTKEIERCNPLYIQDTESSYHTKKLYKSITDVPENDFVSALSNQKYKDRPSASCISLYEDHMVNPSCGDGLSLITGVLARNISEVCKALKNPKVGPPPNDRCFKLISIKKYIQPVVEGDIHPLYSELTDEEFCNSPECLEFCIDFDLAKELGQEPCNDAIEYQMNVITNIFSHYADLGLEVSGKAESLLFWHDSNLSISINSNSEFTSSNYEYSFNLQINLQSSETISSIYPILLEDENVLLLEQLLDSIDLEPAIYQTPNGLLDARQYNKYVVKNRISQSTGVIDISGSASLSFPYRRLDNDNSIFINILSQSYSLLRSRYATKNNFIRARGSSEISSITKYVHNVSYAIIRLDISSIILPFVYQSLGGVVFDSNPIIVFTNRTHVAEGLIQVSSQDQKVGRSYLANAELIVSGSCSVNIKFNANAPVVIDARGFAETVSSTYFYDSILEANARSMAILYYNNLYYGPDVRDFGLHVSKAEVSSNISSVSREFIILDGLSSLQINNNRVNVCGCLSIDTNLNLSHNLNSAGVLSQYLIRNNYTLPESVSLKYNSNKNAWIANKSFTGRSLNSNAVEDWNLIFELSCSNIISGQESDSSYLRFGFFARRYNRSSNLSWITKISTNIVPSLVCQNNNLITKITLNTVTNDIFVDNILNSLSNVSDNIGLFKNSYWFGKVDCSYARKESIGKGRRDGFAKCGVNGPFPEFKINYPNNPVMTYFDYTPATQVIL